MYIALRDVDITEETSKVALEKRDRLVFIPAEQNGGCRHSAHPQSGERDVADNWSSRQHRLEAQMGLKGFSGTECQPLLVLETQHYTSEGKPNHSLGNRRIEWPPAPTGRNFLKLDRSIDRVKGSITLWSTCLRKVSCQDHKPNQHPPTGRARQSSLYGDAGRCCLRHPTNTKQKPKALQGCLHGQTGSSAKVLRNGPGHLHD